jgi:hypothetical protein
MPSPLGVPVVAIGANGILDIIDHGRTGLLADPSDDTAQQIIDNVQLLIENSTLRERIGQEARQWAEQWNWQAATDKLRTSQYRAAISLHHIRYNQTLQQTNSSIAASLTTLEWLSLTPLMGRTNKQSQRLQGEAEIMRRYSV